MCGDILELSVRFDGRQIDEIRFLAKGCVPTMACGSAITELAKGKSIDAARRISREELIEKVGGLPQASAHASHLTMETLAALLRSV